MLVDTHIHLYSAKFSHDRPDVVLRARAADVDVLVVPGIDVGTTREAIRLCGQYDGVFAMAAIHPSETKVATDEDMAQIRVLAQDAAVVAVGETGLDYYWDRSFDDIQQVFFRRHVRLALDLDLPLVIHSRDKKDREEVFEDLVRILREERGAAQTPERLRGVFHCFGGPEWLIREAHDLGFMLGIGGTLTYKNAGVDALIRSIPLSQVVLETDAPYLAPVPNRGKRNEPAFLVHVAERMAEVLEMDSREVANRTSANAAKLYDLPVTSGRI